MKYSCLIIVCIVAFLTSVFSQPEKKRIADVTEQIRQSKNDTNKVALYIELSALYRESDSVAAFAAVEKAKALSEQLHYQRGLIAVLVYTGAIYETAEKDYPSAIHYYEQAIQLAEEIHSYTEITRAHSCILNLYFYLGDFPDAMKIATKGLVLSEQLKDRVKEANYQSLIGFIYLKQGNSNLSEKYYQQYLSVATELKDSIMLGDAYNNMADVYELEHNYTASLSALFTSLAIYEKMNGTVYISKTATKSIDKKERAAYVFYKISNTCKLMGDYKRALPYALNAIKYVHQASGCNRYDVAGYYINTGAIYVGLKDFANARQYLQQGLTIATEIKHREDIRDAYINLSQTYALHKQYDSAYRYYILYDELKDSIVNENSRREIEQIHSQYQVEKKDKEIALLNQQEILKENEIKRQNLVRNIIIGSILFVGIILYLLYNRRRLQQKSNFQEALNKQKNELLNTVLAIQDKERKRIAEDIHDSVGSILSAAKLNLSWLEEDRNLFTNEQKSKYQATLALLDEAASELRNISHNIMPATLSRLGLIAALQNLFDRISSHSGLRISFTSYGFSERINEEVEMSIYRIILELVNNVVKHAHADEVTVQLIKHASYINITVEDNGTGFNYRQVSAETKGIGLNNIMSRVDYLKGRIDIDSRKGVGTTILIDIPYS